MVEVTQQPFQLTQMKINVSNSRGRVAMPFMSCCFPTEIYSCGKKLGIRVQRCIVSHRVAEGPTYGTFIVAAKRQVNDGCLHIACHPNNENDDNENILQERKSGHDDVSYSWCCSTPTTGPRIIVLRTEVNALIHPKWTCDAPSSVIYKPCDEANSEPHFIRLRSTIESDSSDPSPFPPSPRRTVKQSH